MALEKIMYALRNMQVANSILSIKNSSFFKRVISRMILIRLPDFIRYARMVNNGTKGNRSKVDHAKVKEGKQRDGSRPLKKSLFFSN